MAEESAKLRIPYIAAAQAQKHVTHNEAMTLLDTIVQLSVLDKDLTAPPGSPAEGDCYIVAASATGAWISWDNRIARYIDGEWRSYLPGAGNGAGWRAYVIDEAALYIFNGSAWVAFSGGGVSDGDKGDITVSSSGTVWSIDNDAVSFAKLQNVASDRLIGRDAASSGDPEELTVGGGVEFTGSGGIQRSVLTGDVTASAGSNATTIANDAVTNAKLANVATATFKGRTTAGTGDPEDLTATQATALLNVVVGDSGSGGTKGLVPAPATGDAAAGKFLKADGTFAVPSGGGGVSDGDKGDITASSSGTVWTVDNNTITDAKLRDSAALSVIGRSANSTGDPADIAVSSDGEVLRRSGTTLGFGSVATAGIANDAVTYAKIQNVSATDRLLGRSTAGAGDVEEVICTTAGRAILDDADAASQLVTLGARGQGLETIWIPASAMSPRSTSGAGEGSYDSGANDITILTLDFDTTTQEFAHFAVAMPKSWNEGTVTFIPYWTNTGGASTQNVVWSLAGRALSNDDAANGAFGTAQTSNDTWLAQNDIHIGPTSSAITIGNSPAENDLVVFEVSRVVGSDTMAGDALLIGLKLLFTTNAPTDA